MEGKVGTATILTLLLMGTLIIAFNVEVGEASLPPIDWTRYHTYSEIVTILFALNDTYPDVVDVFSIGKSWGNRDIYCVRLTNESDSRFKSEVFFVGYHHAREPITAELPLYFVVYAATNFGSNATVTELLNKSEIYVIVALNVDGFDLFSANDWQRKNGRPTDEDYDGLTDEDPPEDEDYDGFIEQLFDVSDPSNPLFIRWEGTDNDGDGKYAEDWIGGVDLNRNYDYAWQGGSSSPRSEIYKGPAPFSEPETQALRNLVLQHNFKFAISFHSGTDLILYPWGYTHASTPDDSKFVKIAQDLSSLTGGTPYEQSSDLYISYGTWDDWMYGIRGIFALTCEIFVNQTWEGVMHPGPYPNTVWSGGLKYNFNPFPSAIESTILRWLPVFFYITKRSLADVAVERIESAKAVVGQGYTALLNVSVRNDGFFSETFNVTLYTNTTRIQTQAVTVEQGAAKTFILALNASGLLKGKYTLSAYAEPVPGELNTTNNAHSDGNMIVAMIGDITGIIQGVPDGKVDIRDVATAAKAFSSSPGQPRWNPNADITGVVIGLPDNKVDIKDIAAIAKNFGKIDP